MATPVKRSSRESHWSLDKDLLSMRTLNRAVVRIFSWYVTWRGQKVRDNHRRDQKENMSETTTGETRETCQRQPQERPERQHVRDNHRRDQRDNMSVTTTG